jgi:hypothetical protein
VTPGEHAQLRQHCLTASRAKRLLTGSYKVWNTLAKEMRAEQRVLGRAPKSIPSLHWGVKHEPWLRAEVWERYPAWEIEPVEFQMFHGEHPLLSRHCGASPDGRVLPRGWGYEGKCPYDPEIHAGYLERTTVPEEYIPQVQWSLWVTGWPGWIFASGDPRRTDDGRLLVRAAEPDLAMHQKFEELATRFLESYLAGESFQPVSGSAAKLAEMFK